jgi:hypothetical protein
MSIFLLLTALSLAIGVWIFFLINSWLGIAFIVLNFVMLFVCMRYRCKYCYYYGKRCYMGLGKLAKVFKKGNAKEFSKTKNLVPALVFMMITIFSPIIAGIIALIVSFSWLVVVLLVAYLFIAIIPNFFLKKSLCCDRCIQGKLGCPAYEGMKGK